MSDDKRSGDPFVVPTKDEVLAMREIIAHAVVMLMMCPCDEDTTKKYEASVHLFKASMKKLHDLEVANGRAGAAPSGGDSRG